MDTLSKLSLGHSGWGDELFIGALMTVSLAVVSLIIGLLIGGVLALCKIQPITTLRGFAHGLTLLFRGTPEFLVILVVFLGSISFNKRSLEFYRDRSQSINTQILGGSTWSRFDFRGLCF